ncbi:MAG: NAD-dependent epimerase/dehydratase family protein [Planctomycetota bacterium]
MKALVTGGTGFLGRAIVDRLVERGNSVRVLSRGITATDLPPGVEPLQGDIADPKVLLRGVLGCDVVFHTAAKAGVGGRPEEYERANLLGTRNVLEACRSRGIPRLVHTSTPSVVFDGTDIEGGDESLPYPDHYEADYPRTKAAAEKEVLAANGPHLATTALRPHLIWGPGDNHLVPRLLERARAGKLRRVGDGTNRVDHVFIDNAADAHLLAADRLEPGGAAPAGKAYFITNGEPVPLWDLVDRLLAAAGLPPVEKAVSPRAALAAGWLLETVHGALDLKGEPRMTRWVARELATSHWFDIGAARRDLGYEPAVLLDEGLARLSESLREQPA